MKFSNSILSFLVIGMASICLQHCAVDPLDGTGAPNTNGTTGYTVCSDKTLTDTDTDGVNDECEKMLGTDPNSKDSDGDGIPDNSDMPPPTSPPSTCPPAANATQDVINYCGAIEAQKDQLLQDTARSSILASSGLNESAPSGTKVEVQDQYVRVIYGRTTSKTSDGNSTDNSGMASLSPDAKANVEAICKENGQIMETFLYYQIRGDMMYCLASGGKCEDKSTTTTYATMRLCGKLDETKTGDLRSTSLSAITLKDFKWIKGQAINLDSKGKYSTIDFDPNLLQGGKIIPNVELVITPSTPANSVYHDMKLKFTSTFQIYGTINDGNVDVKTPEIVTATKDFNRKFTIDPQTYLKSPGLTGEWQPK